MERNLDYVPNYPYLVVKTDGSIIEGHNEIFGKDFTNFLRHFYVRHIVMRINFPRRCYGEKDGWGEENGVPLSFLEAKAPICQKTEITPCVESCRRDKGEGGSCSGRPGEPP